MSSLSPLLAENGAAARMLIKIRDAPPFTLVQTEFEEAEGAERIMKQLHKGGLNAARIDANKQRIVNVWIDERTRTLVCTAFGVGAAEPAPTKGEYMTVTHMGMTGYADRRAHCDAEIARQKRDEEAAAAKR